MFSVLDGDIKILLTGASIWFIDRGIFVCYDCHKKKREG